jgi:hypothetical protein
LPRDLEDVLDYFLPSTQAGAPTRQARDEPGQALDGERPPALPIVAIPIAEGDVVRAAFAWNLAVEIARLGASATLVAPRAEEAAAFWPESGRGPVGAELVLSPRADLGSLNRVALDVAVSRAADASEGGLVLARVLPEWIDHPPTGRALLRRVLLFATPEPRDLLRAYALAKSVFNAGPATQVGVTIHGARRLGDAERAFHQLASVATRHLGRSPVSYGLLLDDLHVYRAIVSRRPIGLEHPQSRAARALGDVARLLLEDSRKTALA